MSTCAEIDVVAAIGHVQALREQDLWGTVDVVVLDAADEERSGDQFPGVRVVRHIRTHAAQRQPTLVVVTGHFFDDGLRLRMAEADADFFFLRPEIRSTQKLVDIILSPERYRRGVPQVRGKHEQALLGITDASTLEGFVEYVEVNELESALEGGHKESRTHGRRSLNRHRIGLGKASRIDTQNISTGFPPHADQKGPSMRQIRKIWAFGARVKYPRGSSPT